MAGTFPTLKSGRIAFYGTEQALVRKVEVVQFVNDTEQRWRSAQPLFRGSLEYVDANLYDISLLQQFFWSQKGEFDNTWSLTIEDPPGTSTTWNNMTFDQDDFTYTESKPMRYTATLKVRQVRK